MNNIGTNSDPNVNNISNLINKIIIIIIGFNNRSEANYFLLSVLCPHKAKMKGIFVPMCVEQ